MPAQAGEGRRHRSLWPIRAQVGARLASVQVRPGATQVAKWAGHSVQVLLKVYAKCVVGQEEATRYRTEAA